MTLYNYLTKLISGFGAYYLETDRRETTNHGSTESAHSHFPFFFARPAAFTE